jgi:hypothetical protein
MNIKACSNLSQWRVCQKATRSQSDEGQYQYGFQPYFVVSTHITYQVQCKWISETCWHSHSHTEVYHHCFYFHFCVTNLRKGVSPCRLELYDKDNLLLLFDICNCKAKRWQNNSLSMSSWFALHLRGEKLAGKWDTCTKWAWKVVNVSISIINCMTFPDSEFTPNESVVA